MRSRRRSPRVGGTAGPGPRLAARAWREFSRDTLSLGELIASLESSRVTDGEDAWLMSPICGGFNLLPGEPSLAVQREHLRRATQFPVPASPLYPRLREWYADQHDAWLDRHLIECMEIREQA